MHLQTVTKIIYVTTHGNEAHFLLLHDYISYVLICNEFDGFPLFLLTTIINLEQSFHHQGHYKAYVGRFKTINNY